MYKTQKAKEEKVSVGGRVWSKGCVYVCFYGNHRKHSDSRQRRTERSFVVSWKNMRRYIR